MRWCSPDHEIYPSIADVTGDFVYARLQRGEDTIPTAYPPKQLGRLGRPPAEAWAKGGEPQGLPRVDKAL